jgi:ABC-type multidrug transport system permease subunit
MVWAKDQMSCEWAVLVGSMMVMILAVYRIIHSTSLVSLLVSLIAKQLAYLQKLMAF